MTRRRRILISAGIVAVCIAATIGVLALLPAHPGVTKSNFHRIQKGMTRDEVIAILGKDSDDVVPVQKFTCDAWRSQDENGRRDIDMLIRFENDRVSGKWWHGRGGALETIRRWLRI